MNPQDPLGYGPYGPFSYDPLGRVPPAPPPVELPPVPAPPPPSSRPPVNTLATQSLVFAFLSPPVGAVLGHLALARIRRTGEPGRSRALAGVVLSYAFVTLVVLALLGWAALAAFRSGPAPTAAPATTAAAPPGPTVAPGGVATLLPSVGDLKTITDDQNLEAGQTWDHPARSDREGTIDRPECWGAIAPGTPDAYSVDALFGYHAAEFSDTRSLLKSVQVIDAAAAFRDGPAAQSQLQKLQDGWRQCGGTTVSVTIPEAGAIPFAVSPPADAGNGITTLGLTPKGLQVRSARAIAAKANVVVDLYVSYSGTTDADRPRTTAVSIANFVLNKIPG
ncbi:sensor domain-containing protein [Mycobacterium paraense]|uniref:sensor domain-containing protein n=1 Tax=Mycobacterium paraense TaxID=767916 RepID=UPI000A14EC28|nr:sensor domain-containing protein [Mycobacterium paraense]MCV7444382.1 sensor domain-containing protein [Mycobacterium paraense]ORW44617.1 nuclease PIN [Mycobacterium paraense]